MKSNISSIILLGVLLALCYFTFTAEAASLHHKAKRSPFLRLDELSTKIYLAKNKLGGGLIDPLEIGKRSARSENSVQIDPETNLAVSIYDGLSECIYREECLSSLRLLLNDE